MSEPPISHEDLEALRDGKALVFDRVLSEEERDAIVAYINEHWDDIVPMTVEPEQPTVKRDRLIVRLREKSEPWHEHSALMLAAADALEVAMEICDTVEEAGLLAYPQTPTREQIADAKARAAGVIRLTHLEFKAHDGIIASADTYRLADALQEAGLLAADVAGEQPQGRVLCGARCAYRWIEGHAADERLCERTSGPCPHPPEARANMKGSDPCAAEQASVAGEQPEWHDIDCQAFEGGDCTCPEPPDVAGEQSRMKVRKREAAPIDDADLLPENVAGEQSLDVEAWKRQAAEVLDGVWQDSDSRRVDVLVDAGLADPVAAPPPTINRVAIVESFRSRMVEPNWTYSDSEGRPRLSAQAAWDIADAVMALLPSTDKDDT